VTYEQVLTRLKKLANPKNVAGMARFGISSKGTLGISIPNLRRLAREIGRDHELALAKQIARIDSPAARWIAADALRELRSAAVRRRLQAPRRSIRVSS